MTDYPYIHAWGRLMGHTDDQIAERTERAIQDNAPYHSLYLEFRPWTDNRAIGTWVTSSLCGYAIRGAIRTFLPKDAHKSADGYNVVVGARFWDKDLRVVEITEVADHTTFPYSDTGCGQTWHMAPSNASGIVDTHDGWMRPHGGIARYFEGYDAEKYEPGTYIGDIK